MPLQVKAVAADREAALARTESVLSQRDAQLAALAESQGRMAQQYDALSQELQDARQDTARFLQESEVGRSCSCCSVAVACVHCHLESCHVN